jgi:hypothetical protein
LDILGYGLAADAFPNPPNRLANGLQNGLQRHGLQNAKKKAFRNLFMRKAL